MHRKSLCVREHLPTCVHHESHTERRNLEDKEEEEESLIRHIGISMPPSLKKQTNLLIFLLPNSCHSFSAMLMHSVPGVQAQFYS